MLLAMNDNDDAPCAFISLIEIEIFFFFFTLVTGPKRSLSLKLSDTRVDEPQIRACLGTTAPFMIETETWGFRILALEGRKRVYLTFQASEKRKKRGEGPDCDPHPTRQQRPLPAGGDRVQGWEFSGVECRV